MGSKCDDLLNKFTISGSCGFPLANLHFAVSLDYVPISNPLNQLILLCICSVNLYSQSIYAKSLKNLYILTLDWRLWLVLNIRT